MSFLRKILLVVHLLVLVPVGWVKPRDKTKIERMQPSASGPVVALYFSIFDPRDAVIFLLTLERPNKKGLTLETKQKRINPREPKQKI